MARLVFVLNWWWKIRVCIYQSNQIKKRQQGRSNQILIDNIYTVTLPARKYLKVIRKDLISLRPWNYKKNSNCLQVDFPLSPWTIQLQMIAKVHWKRIIQHVWESHFNGLRRCNSASDCTASSSNNMKPWERAPQRFFSSSIISPQFFSPSWSLIPHGAHLPNFQALMFVQEAYLVQGQFQNPSDIPILPILNLLSFLGQMRQACCFIENYLLLLRSWIWTLWKKTANVKTAS